MKMNQAASVLPGDIVLKVRLANALSRGTNVLLDTIAILGFMWFFGQELHAIWPAYVADPAQLMDSRDMTTLLMYQLAVSLPYYLLLETYFGKSLGKFVTKTRVVNAETGELPSGRQVLIRTLMRNIPLEYLWYIFSVRGPHDFLSNTFVIDDDNEDEEEN